jgi:hypothetical protein
MAAAARVGEMGRGTEEESGERRGVPEGWRSYWVNWIKI